DVAVMEAGNVVRDREASGRRFGWRCRSHHRGGRAGVPSLCGRDPAVREGVRAAPLTGRRAMRIMANENVPGPVVAALRSAGHDVVWSKETLPEQRTVRYSRVREAEARLVVTFDKDLGELAVRSRVPASGG